jgi:aspartate aminotransferase
MKLAKNLQRLGTESAFSVLAEAKKLEAQGKPMIHLGLGQPDFKTPQHVVDAAKKALDEGHHGYVLSNGILECRQAVTRKIKKLYNKDIDPERVLIMPGIMQYNVLVSQVQKLYIQRLHSQYMNQ